MPWYSPSAYLTENVKKRVGVYLIQHYLGQFLETKLTADQLSVDLTKGIGTIENVSLDMEALKELANKQNLPVEFVSGYIGKLIFYVPWTSFLRDPTNIEVHGLKITVQAKQRVECATSMFESMWSSMTNSMQLAEECLKQDAEAVDNSQPLEGLEVIAQAIESILCRVKVKFVNTTFQFECLPKDSLTGVALIATIDSIEYTDESGEDPPANESSDKGEQNKAYIVTSFTTKNFTLEGISFATQEFTCASRFTTECTESQYSQADSLVSQVIQEANDSQQPADDEEADTAHSQRIQDSSAATRADSSLQNILLFAKIIGKQVVRIRLKQSEVVSGPKVSIEMTFGALNVFLSPRQVYDLVEIASGLFGDTGEDLSSTTPKQKCTEKPMTGLDYQRVEQELQCQLNPAMFAAPGLQGTHGWSTAQFEESDTDDNFLPMHSRDPGDGMADSTYSNASSSMESSLSSSMASSLSEATTHRTRRKFNSIQSDPTAEISHFHIRIASLVVVLLHEDILTMTNESGTPGLIPSSVKQMQTTAEHFFATMSNLVPAGYGARNFDDCKATFERACKKRHLRLVAAPLQVECHETTTSSAFSISGELTTAKMELLECLVKDEAKFEYVRLVYFKDDASIGSPVHAKPCMKMSFRHVEKTRKGGIGRKSYIPKTDLHFTLDTCVLDVDITIIDRLSALLNPPTVIQKPQNVWATQSCKADTLGATPDSIMDIKLTAQSMLLKLRIPIPDFRAANDLQRVPWWDRNVRNAFIAGRMSHVLAQTAIHSCADSQTYTIQCRTLDLYYHENETAAPLHIGKSTIDDAPPSSTSSCMPTVTIKVNPLVKLDVEVEETMDQDGVMTMSCGTIIPPQRQGPFSSKRVIHESDTPHARTPADEENAELVLPGTKAEMSDFIQATIGSTRIHLDFNFPTASVQFLSKHIFEVLYNHILSDLLLWEPCAPVSKCADGNAMPQAMFESFERMETYATCKSGNKYESDSDESEEFDAQNSTLFYSAYDMRHKPAKKQQQVKRKCQSYLTLSLRIGKGLIRMCPPVRDVDGNVIPEQIAEFLLGVEEASLFTVSGYNGDESLGYVCVQSKGAQLHHSDMISTTSQNHQLKEIGSALGRHLFPTIYKSESGILETSENRAGDREMLSVAVRIQANHETHHVKLVRVALGLNKATLRHRMCPVPNIWITQLIDLFKVNDYTIPGFHAKDVLTEMHLHLWDCAIDFRPRHLPLRSVITMGQLSMSSHLTTTANTTTLRFIAEDCNLFLSDKLPPKKGVPSIAPIELRRDYVGIIDVGLIEISLKINDIAFPHCDLRALVNKFRIHTCADSARALMELITYIATNGDLNDQEQASTTVGHYASPKRHVEQELVAVETQDISNLSKSQHQQVNDMLVDAMKESVQVPRANNTPMTTGAKLFFFPDEGQQLPENCKPLPQVTTDLGDITFRSNRSSDTDEDFIFIGDEAGVGIMPKNGLPQIRWLIDDSLRLVDNHFSIPVGKTDVLKAPKDFPTPVMRYTLCEMTVQWKLYAGRDFRSADDKMEKKSVNFLDGQNAVLYTNRNTGEISFQSKAQKKKTKANWIERGGVNRDHEIVIDIQLNKVRVQHDIYPEHTMQASRQVIVISQIEIHDRLVSSRIKKLLYLDSTDIRPRQTHANMLTIKLIHIRPDLKLKAEECILVLGLLPLRINLDQDTLLFMLNFASDMITDTTKIEDMATNSKTNTPTHHPPVMTITSDEVMDDVEAKKLVDENLILLLDDVKDKVENAKVEKNMPTTTTAADNSTPIYFRKVTFVNPVPIRLDYHSKGNFDWKHGPIAALVIGIASLNYVEFTLKRLENNHGILGFDKLIQYFAQEWKNDIKRNQIHTVLSGVGPIHSLVQLFQGVRDLIWMPIEQYQKDGRIVRGLQRGANSFTTSTAMAALELTNRFINLIQLTAETAYDMMSPGPSVRRALAIKAKGRKKRYNQPQDIREGVANAYNVVKEGLGETAENIVRVASIEKEQKGFTGAVGGVLRQIPTTMIKPIIIASEATSNVLGGMQCQLMPDAKREANEKWKNDGDL